MRGCGFQVAKSIVQDRVSSYQRGFKNRHRNSEVWKRVGKFGSLSTKIQRHGPGKGFEVLGGHSPPRPLGFMRSVTGTRMCHQVLNFTCSPKLRKKRPTEEITNILHGWYFAPKAATFAENRFFCLPQVLRSMTRSAGDVFKVRALLACLAGAGLFFRAKEEILRTCYAGYSTLDVEYIPINSTTEKVFAFAGFPFTWIM